MPKGRTSCGFFDYLKGGDGKWDDRKTTEICR
nr:MAG TPA: hypothetical protein [Caudoviricetes sp.]